MYRYHPHVAARIQALTDTEIQRNDEQRRLVGLLTERLRPEKEVSAALVRTCAELAVRLLWQVHLGKKGPITRVGFKGPES